MAQSQDLSFAGGSDETFSAGILNSTAMRILDFIWKLHLKDWQGILQTAFSCILTIPVSVLFGSSVVGRLFHFLCVVPMLLGWSLSKAFSTVTGGVWVCSPCLALSGLQYFFCFLQKVVSLAFDRLFEARLIYFDSFPIWKIRKDIHVLSK